MRAVLAVSLVLLGVGVSAPAAEPIEIALWPDKPPGFQVESGPERDTTGPDGRPVAGKPVIRLGDVSKPQLHVYRPASDKANGTSVVICPGGGFNILAWDLEGTEVAEWFNSIGVTAAVLKYRVPTAKQEPNWLPPAQDAQRAVRIIRSQAEEWNADPRRVGLMGFSAGGRTAAMAALTTEERLYEPVDEADKNSPKPDFLALIYTAYLVDDAGKLKPEIAVTKDSPPTFFVHAYDDPVTPKSSVQLFLALKDAGVPAELHVYDAGGHGYGLRPTDMPITAWPQRCEDWLRGRGLLRAGAK